jgi:hypothetical protein
VKPYRMTEAIHLIVPLVDVQPVYKLGAALGAEEGSAFGEPAVQAFLRYQLARAEEEMRVAARYIRDRLAVQRQSVDDSGGTDSGGEGRDANPRRSDP